uniref:Uncharacterized protein n=1 Tax=Panagrellus redivivus TaxID=6233 RepID=A0A7E4VN82_PANRE
MKSPTVSHPVASRLTAKRKPLLCDKLKSARLASSRLAVPRESSHRGGKDCQRPPPPSPDIAVSDRNQKLAEIERRLLFDSSH